MAYLAKLIVVQDDTWKLYFWKEQMIWKNNSFDCLINEIRMGQIEGTSIFYSGLSTFKMRKQKLNDIKQQP
jgi:hypothetical protein